MQVERRTPHWLCWMPLRSGVDTADLPCPAPPLQRLQRQAPHHQLVQHGEGYEFLVPLLLRRGADLLLLRARSLSD